MRINRHSVNVSDLALKAGLTLRVASAVGLLYLVACGASSPAIGTYFSIDYVTARGRFREAAALAGGRLTALELAAKGPHGEDLTIDIAWFGPERPRGALVHSSGVHGVEAFAGSAIQLQWLNEGLPEIPEDSAIVLVHVLNPYGMAWLRRFNEHNVDLNRNFLGPDEAYEGASDGYDQLDPFLNPPSPPSWGLFYPRAGWLILRVGLPTLRQTVAGGQYVNPKGLFWGGSTLEEGPRAMGRFVQDTLGDVEHLVVVDVHTGLGPFGEDTLLVHAADEEDPLFTRMHETFGDRVSSMDPERGPAYRVRGAYNTMYPRALPTADVHFVAQEFGTYHVVRVVKALRAENRWHHYGDGGIDHPTKINLRERFAPDDESWRKAVLERGSIVIGQALALLRAGPFGGLSSGPSSPARGQKLVTPLRGPRRRDAQLPRHRLEILPAQQTQHHCALAPDRKPAPTAAPGGSSGSPPDFLRRRRTLIWLPHLDTPPASNLSQSSVQENPGAQDNPTPVLFCKGRYSTTEGDPTL